MWDNGTKIAEYEYNADGTKKHVKNGSLYTEYTYDADRNLTGLKTLLGAETIVDNRYTYDGNGDRLEKYQKHGTTRYGYDSMRRLAKVEYPNATEELFYDKAGNRTRRLYNGAEELYQYDKRNRLTAHTKGGVTSQYEYDNAGNLTTCEEKVHNRFKFNGQQYDPISQQCYMRARYYNPVIGRFTQENSYNVDGLNLYAYCRNNPVYYVDPSGNICEKRANEIINKLNLGGVLSNSEKKKQAAYLRNKGRRTEGGLTDAESQILNQVDRKTNNKAEAEARRILGPYYDIVLKLHEQNPAYYEHPNKYRIVEGVEYDNTRKEYDKMTDRGYLQRGHHRLGVADGEQNIPSNIAYTAFL